MITSQRPKPLAFLLNYVLYFTNTSQDEPTFDLALSAWYILESGNMRTLKAFLTGPASRIFTIARLSNSYKP